MKDGGWSNRAPRRERGRRAGIDARIRPGLPLGAAGRPAPARPGGTASW